MGPVYQRWAWYKWVHFRWHGNFHNGSLFSWISKVIIVSQSHVIKFLQVGPLTNWSHLTRYVQILDWVPLTWHWSFLCGSLFLLHGRLARGSVWSISVKLNWVQMSKHVIPQVGPYSYRIAEWQMGHIPQGVHRHNCVQFTWYISLTFGSHFIICQWQVGLFKAIAP